MARFGPCVERLLLLSLNERMTALAPVVATACERFMISAKTDARGGLSGFDAARGVKKWSEGE